MTPRQSEIADKLARDIRAKLIEYGPILFGKSRGKINITIVPQPREDDFQVELNFKV